MTIIEYQAGKFPGQGNDDVEVMLESTAELMSAAGTAVNCRAVVADQKAMADGLTTRERLRRQALYTKSYVCAPA